MIFTPEIIAIYILNGIFFIFATIAFILSIKIYSNWDMQSTTNSQYKLEKYSYLTATIIKYIFVVKLPLFLFFIFTIDKISNLLVGAMCGAGVIDATQFGTNLIVLKIINLYLFGFWLVINRFDNIKETLPFTKNKFGFFIPLFILFIIEIILEIVMFSSIDPSKMVSCCGTLYRSTASTYISSFFSIDTSVLLGLFYGNFILLVGAYFYKNGYLYSVLSVLFLIISIISLISFFGTYIYQLPTHHCPFCFLQKDYYYVGYLIYVTLFLGTFYGLVVSFFKEDIFYKTSLLFVILYTLIVTLYPVIYYFNNGVWL